MGFWDEDISKEEAEAERLRETILDIERGAYRSWFKDGTGEIEITARELERSKVKLADTLARIERMKAKND